MDLPLFKCSRCDFAGRVRVIVRRLVSEELEYCVICESCNYTQGFSEEEISKYNAPIGFSLNNLEAGGTFEYYQ